MPDLLPEQGHQQRKDASEAGVTHGNQVGQVGDIARDASPVSGTIKGQTISNYQVVIETLAARIKPD